jgi:hypothetical protein
MLFLFLFFGGKFSQLSDFLGGNGKIMQIQGKIQITIMKKRLLLMNKTKKYKPMHAQG